jgi:CRP-like cAMP-binding protein
MQSGQALRNKFTSRQKFREQAGNLVVTKAYKGDSVRHLSPDACIGSALTIFAWLIPSGDRQKFVFMHKLIRNRILLGLAGSDLQTLFPLLRQVWLTPDMTLTEHEQRPAYAYFPESGIVSVITCGAHGRRCNVGIYGSEGFGNLAVLLGASTSSSMEIVQLGGFALRIGAEELRQAIAILPALRTALLRYTHIFMMQISYGAMSSSSTTIDQRLARWLLMFQDRIRERNLAVTHQRLADILGVRRSGVTEAIHTLEGRKLIDARRGMISIIDRPQLEILTGGCYGPPEMEYRRLM